jgi:hypothetical protein
MALGRLKLEKQFLTEQSDQNHSGKMFSIRTRLVGQSLEISWNLQRAGSGDYTLRGYQVAVAAQLGVLNKEKGFEKFAWLPGMNTPVFSLPEEFGKDEVLVDASDFKYGYPKPTKIPTILTDRRRVEHGLGNGHEACTMESWEVTPNRDRRQDGMFAVGTHCRSILR